MKKRYFIVIIGSCLIGFGISLSISSGLGTDPLSLMYALAATIFSANLGVGNAIISVIMLVVTFAYKKKLIGFGTILCPLFIGLSLNVIGVNILQPNYFLHRIIVLVIGLVIISIGTALYIKGELGTSPYDSSIIMLSDLSNCSYGRAKMILDGLFIILYYFYFRKVDPAPFIAVIIIGPLIDVWLSIFARVSEM